jgi:TonB-dependent starch-binding outer membrane protein SusC
MGMFRPFKFNLKRSAVILGMFCLASTLAIGQQRTVKGKVTSESEGPLPGVNIVLQGTTQGTMTDGDGNYTINVPGPESILIFSFISYKSQSVVVGNQMQVDVSLEPSVSTLTEVVVTGYGTQRKKEITSSIANVKADEFNKGNISTPEQLLVGKVSGLSINKPGSDPNGTYDIRLRGLSTVGANTQPLVVIDGIIGGSLANVDPNDIESMSVLKDGSAAAIYGSRGSSGVILVTTKRGDKGRSVVEYNGYVTAEMVAKTVPVMNATEWRKLSKEVGAGTDLGASTDWFKETTQAAYTDVQNISVSGGSDKSTYRASFNYRNGTGIQLNTGYTQLNGRVNLTQKALKDKLTIDLNVGTTKKDIKYGFSDAFRYATVYNPTAPVRSSAPKYAIYDGYFNQDLYDYYNPVQILEENKNDGQDRLFEMSARATYNITKRISADAFYSTMNDNLFKGTYYDMNSYWKGADKHGNAIRTNENKTSQLFESTLKWAGDIADKINLTAIGGYSYQDFVNDGFSAEGGNFLTDAFGYNNLAAALDFKNGKGTIKSYKDSNKLIAFFGRVNLNVNNLVFISASARYEGSSRFGANNKWGLFPSLGGGLDLAKILDISAIDNLKVRASYGVTGNMPKDSYRSLLRLGPQGNFFYNGAFVPGYEPVSNANKDLKWEKKGEFDAGVDFAFFKSRLAGSIDFYSRNTTDLLFSYEVPVPPNLYKTALLNLGEIKSSGIELSLTFNAVSKKDFSYSLSLTPSYNLENTLVSLSGTYNGAKLTYGTRDLGGMGAPGQSDVPLVRAQEGKPIGQIYTLVYKGIDEAGNVTFVDENKDGTIDPADRRVTGNGLPKLLLGFGHNLSYKNWDLNVFFRGVFGHDLINSYRAFYEVPAYITSYNLPKTTADMRNPKTHVLMNSSSGILSSFHVENASFVSLDNMSLGYNFKMAPGSSFSKIRLYFAGNNLFYITKYKGVDPQPRYGDTENENNPLIPGVDRRNTWFRTRSVSFGANIVF